MKLQIDYDKLMNGLTYVGSVANSQLSLEANRTVVFAVSQNNLSLYGESATIGAITDFEPSEYAYESDNEGDMFQIKTKELLSFLNTFSVDRTMPTNVDLVLEGTRLTLTVHEEPLEGQPSYLKNQSHWVFDTTPIKKSTLENMTINEGEDMVNTELLSIYIGALFPLLSNADANMNDSKIQFEDTYAYVFTSKTFALFKNKLPQCMRGIVLGYAGIQLLKQLSAEYDQILVSKSDEASKIYVSAGNNRMAIKFSRKMPSYTKMLEALTTDNYFVIDRQMLSSVINRLSLTNDKTDLKVNLQTEMLEVGNKKFHQNLPITEFKGNDLSEFNIGVVTGILKDSILGDDSLYPEELVIRPTKMDNSWMVTFTDKTDNWLSVFRVASR